MASPKSILVIIVARIGDTLLATPAIRALKETYPSARITVLAHPNRKCLLENLPFIDTLGTITKQRALFQGRFWFAATFDVGLVYGNDRPLIDYASRVCRQVIAFQDKAALPNPRLLAVARHGTQHAVGERLELAKAAGAATDNLALDYVVSAREHDAAAAMLEQLFPNKAMPVIGLQVCSFPTKAHRDWPIAHFSDLINRISASYPRARFLILGDQLAASKASPLLEMYAGRVQSAAGHTTLRESAAIISLLDLYIGVDTGPTHIAGALGVNMVALYHGAYPGRNLAPLNRPRCRVIEHPLTGKAGAAAANMSDISVDQVFQQANQLLQAAVPREQPLLTEDD